MTIHPPHRSTSKLLPHSIRRIRLHLTALTYNAALQHRLCGARHSLRHRPRDFRHGERGPAAGFQRAFQAGQELGFQQIISDRRQVARKNRRVDGVAEKKQIRGGKARRSSGKTNLKSWNDNRKRPAVSNGFKNTPYRVCANISRQSQSERSNMEPSPLCSTGEIIIHCNSRAHTSRCENAASQRPAICSRAAVQFNRPSL